MQGIKNKGKLKVLSKDEVEKIHEATLKVLEKTGVRFDSADAVQRLVKNGALMHPSKKNVITFPRSVVEESIKKIPR